LLSFDECLDETHTEEERLPETMGKRAAMHLLDEITNSGFVDTSNQSLILTLMALTERKVNYLTVGRISTYTIENLRIIREFFGVAFKIQPQEQDNEDSE